MRVHSGSFLLGLGAAALIPVATRWFRPFAVQAATAGLSAFDEIRRVVMEQVEVLEDIAAEAKSRRDEVASAESSAENGDRRAARRTRPASRRAKPVHGVSSDEESA